MNINEQVGFQELSMKIAETYPESVYVLRFIQDFAQKSGCQKIDMVDIKFPAAGLSLPSGLAINNNVFVKYDFSGFLYVLFHELAHQYQYKKYGMEKMFECYTGEISLREGAEFMKYCENVADEFAFRKLRELQKTIGDKVKIKVPFKKVYENAPVEQFEHLIAMFQKILKQKGYKTKEDIGTILYNYVKNGV